MDVTKQFDKISNQYGATGSARLNSLATVRRLDYAKGNSINDPITEEVFALPNTRIYENSVGLYGPESVFVKVNLDIQEAYVAEESAEDSEGYYTAIFLRKAVEGDAPSYEGAAVDRLSDLDIVNGYEQAELKSSVATIVDAVVSVRLENNKTGNIYIDNYLDMGLYGPDKKLLPDDKAYIGIKDHFYLGFHARRTKRLPYKATLRIGEEYRSALDLNSSERDNLVSYQ